jgi:hypothetical protein
MENSCEYIERIVLDSRKWASMSRRTQLLISLLIFPDVSRKIWILVDPFRKMNHADETVGEAAAVDMTSRSVHAQRPLTVCGYY